MPSIDGTILTAAGWRRGRLNHERLIRSVEGTPTGLPEPPFVIPGFVDLHVHGGGGADVMAGADAIRTTLRTHARHGTTSLLATTVTAPVEEIDDVLAAAAMVEARRESGEAALLGVHLEGPFLNPDKLGAQPPYARPAEPALLERWCATNLVRVMTLAPEVDVEGALRTILNAHGARAQLGHTLCRHDEARTALEAGMGVTHLFNAMTALDHRAPGAAGAALAFAEWAEVIPDLIHVEATAIHAARRAIPKLYGITDATAGAGMPDGAYPLGRYTAHKAKGAMRLEDGTLAGSALTMDQALRNLVAIGLALDDAATRLSTLPAQWLGLGDRGWIAPAMRADLVILDDALQVRRVLVAGEDVR
ncbi:MAG: amidohydrolase family protein [Pseudomonadota bacterium]